MTVFFETKGLSVGYNGKTLIHDIDVSLQKGGILSDDHAGGCVLYEKREQVEALLS